MKAIVVEKPFEIGIVEVPMPQIRSDNEVLIKVISGSICGSDIGIYNGTNSLATYPRIIGHEFGGRIVEVGAAVTDVKVGDVVAVDPVRSCGKCYACRHNRPNVCSMVRCVGVHEDGGFAEYVVAPAEKCHKLNPERIDEKMACLVEPYSIGVQVNYRGEITADDTVLVMGSGPIGVAVMQVAKARGARVMMTDIVPERLAHAKECGADCVVDVRTQDLAQEVLCFSDGEGVAVAVDSVCSLTSVPQAMDLVCPAGRVVVLGLKDKPSEIQQVAFTKKEVSVYGSRLNNNRFPEVISLYDAGKIHPEQMCSASFPFEQVKDAFALIQEHPEKICKVRLMFE